MHLYGDNFRNGKNKEKEIVRRRLGNEPTKSDLLFFTFIALWPQ